MMEQQVHFRFLVARMAIDVRCCCVSTQYYCKDFLISDDEIPDLQIVITPEDIEAERIYLSGKKSKDEQLEASTPEALERLVLCRKTAERLLKNNTVLFHCSALAIDGNGILFTAPSGTGKSTHAALWRRVFGRRVVMVNDDKPLVAVENGEIRVYGSPWRGKHGLGENISAPVKAVCLLHRGKENSIERISPREAFPILLQQTYRPKSPEGVLQAMKLADRLSREVAVYRLFCNMEEDAARVAYRGIT